MSVDLELTEWHLVALDGDPIAADRQPTLSFAEGRVSGYAGVNRLMGSYELVQGRVTFGPLATTMMAGPDDALRLERTYLDALDDGGFVEIEGDQLTIRTHRADISFQRAATDAETGTL